jgi:hypothetical protein
MQDLTPGFLRQPADRQADCRAYSYRLPPQLRFDQYDNLSTEHLYDPFAVINCVRHDNAIISVLKEVEVEASGSLNGGQPGDQQAAVMGVLALLVDARESRIAGDKDAAKTELILARVGLPIDDIATVVRKNRDAVRMAVSRGKAK